MEKQLQRFLQIAEELHELFGYMMEHNAAEDKEKLEHGRALCEEALDLLDQWLLEAKTNFVEQEGRPYAAI